MSVMQWWLARLKSTPRIVVALIIFEAAIAVAFGIYLVTGGS
jgi:hypothetical protein